MRLLFLLTLTANLVWTTLASAQVFATIEQCDTIFGTPTPPTEKTSDIRFYRQDGLTVKVLFVDQKAAVLTFTSSSAPKLSADAVQKLLDRSAASNRWEELEGESPKTWRRSDGLAFAVYDGGNGEFNIFSADYIEKSASETQGANNRP